MTLQPTIGGMRSLRRQGFSTGPGNAWWSATSTNIRWCKDGVAGIYTGNINVC